jgi:RNA polymerase sigma-70 factor (ECF subfamily)
MLDDAETRLFVRFRDHADVGALGQLYDQTAVELLRVALHMVREPARAEDLVQQTFLAAIEAAARFDATRRVRAWLLGILANLARKLQRDEARVAVRAEAAAADPVESAAAEEFTAQVDAAIDTLPEVYQPVLVLHLKHGMIAAEIAHALRRPPGTVRTQLVRALELLKKALPAGLALSIGVTMLPMRGLAAARHVVLAHATHHVATLTAAGATPTTGPAGAGTLSIGGATLMKKLVVAAAVVALAFTARFVWLEANAAPPAAPTPGHPVPVQAALPLPAPTPVAPPDGAASTGRQAPPAMPTHGSLRYRFLWASDRSPAVGVFVHVVVWNRANPMATTIDVPTDARGEIALADLEPGSVGAYLDRHDGIFRDVAAGEEANETFLIPRGVTVDVSVVDTNAAPVPNARVWLSHYGNGTKGHEVAVTDAAGRASVRDIGEGRDLAVRAAGFAPSGLLDVEGKPGERKEVTFTLTGDGASLRGIVRTPNGDPCRGARVWIGGFPNIQAKDQAQVRGIPPPFELTTDGDGHFFAAGLPAGSVRVRARAPGAGTFSGKVALRSGETSTLEVALPAAATVTGFVRDEDGRGLANATVSGGDRYGDWGFCSTKTAAGGAFTLCDLTGGSIELHAQLKGLLSASCSVQAVAGQSRAIDFVMTRSKPTDQIRGIVVDENDKPRRNWIVSIEGRQTSDAWSAWLRTDAEGHFLATGCRAKACRVEVFDPEGAGSAYPLLAVDDVRPGGEEVRLCVPESALQFAAFTALVVDAAGRPVTEAKLSAMEPGGYRANTFTSDERGRLRAARLPARRYVLELRAEGHPTLTLGEHEATAGRDTDLGTLVLPRGGRVTVRCRGDVAATMQWARAGVLDAQGETIVSLDLTGAATSSDLLAAGRYDLLVTGQGIAAMRRSFAITDGETTSLDLDLLPGTYCAVEVQDAPDKAWAIIHMAATNSAGETLWTMGLTRRGLEKLSFGLSLGVGTWQLTAKTDTGLTAHGTVVVTDPAMQPPATVLPLR